jgi:hypothetical protein
MSLPTRAWTDESSAGGHGTFNNWVDTDRDADDMIKDLVALIKLFVSADVIFDTYIIYTLPDADGPAQPRSSGTLNVVGTNPTPGWEKATQNTWSFRTVDFGQFKLVLLDSATADNFDRITDFTGLTAVTNVATELSADNNAWSGRDNAQIQTLVQIAVTLNEKLRRSYRMN